MHFLEASKDDRTCLFFAMIFSTTLYFNLLLSLYACWYNTTEGVVILVLYTLVYFSTSYPPQTVQTENQKFAFVNCEIAKEPKVASLQVGELEKAERKGANCEGAAPASVSNKLAGRVV